MYIQYHQPTHIISTDIIGLAWKMDFDLNSIKNESQICLDISEEDTKLFYVNYTARKIVDKSELVKMEN